MTNGGNIMESSKMGNKRDGNRTMIVEFKE